MSNHIQTEIKEYRENTNQYPSMLFNQHPSHSTFNHSWEIRHEIITILYMYSVTLKTQQLMSFTLSLSAFFLSCPRNPLPYPPAPQPSHRYHSLLAQRSCSRSLPIHHHISHCPFSKYSLHFLSATSIGSRKVEGKQTFIVSIPS